MTPFTMRLWRFLDGLILVCVLSIFAGLLPGYLCDLIGIEDPQTRSRVKSYIAITQQIAYTIWFPYVTYLFRILLS
jgi:hypothetical protein